MLYQLGQRAFENAFVSDALLLILCANVVFSSSALSVAALPLRAYPLTIAAYVIITRLLRGPPERLNPLPAVGDPQPARLLPG